MIGAHVDRSAARRWLPLALAHALAAALIVAAFVIDIRVAGVRPINERPPTFAPVDVLRSAVVLAAAGVFVLGTVAIGRRSAAGRG